MQYAGNTNTNKKGNNQYSTNPNNQNKGSPYYSPDKNRNEEEIHYLEAKDHNRFSIGPQEIRKNISMVNPNKSRSPQQTLNQSRITQGTVRIETEFERSPQGLIYTNQDQDLLNQSKISNIENRRTVGNGFSNTNI